MKAANSEERLQATSATQREKRGTLRSAAEGRLSFHDLSAMYHLSRQRVEGYVAAGKQIVETLTPLFIDVNLGDAESQPKKRLGSPTLFTHAQPVAHTNKEGETTHVCICCEAIIEADDEERVVAFVGNNDEVVWCSRECAKEFTVDAWLTSSRYKRHWVSVAQSQEKGARDAVDERSRVREITTDRMNALKALAKKQGY